ncbi:olfactory receptor 10K2-like [Leuresthes tenuis]|uniref:olfactory receptor 10K2-like n=1 Tax=Leuresthes tenuis TaxID=355514 RepID=UPI003B503ACF
MAVRLNVTYIILGGHVEVQRYRYLYFLIMLTAYILIICCNASIVSLIVIHKNLHEPMYIFIAALLINSVLFSTNIYPKLLIDFLSEKQIISFHACQFQVFTFYTLSMSEFLLLAAMSYDRYVSICKPLQYPTIMRKNTVSILLVLAWVVPACHVAVPVTQNVNMKICHFTSKSIFCNGVTRRIFCDTSGTFSVLSLIVFSNIGLCPMLFILFTYTKILIVACKSSANVRNKATQTCLPHLLVLINYSCLLTYDVIMIRVESDFPKTAQLVMTLQIITYHPLFNPVIYGLKMKEITKHLKRLLCQDKVK